MVTLLLSISFYGNLTIINQFLWKPYYRSVFMETLLLLISFYGNLTMELESFLDTCL